MTKTRTNRGFSLVELTIVVVILGVLSSMAVPRFRSSVEKTKATEGYAYLTQIGRQQTRHLAIHGRYARSKQELERAIGETLENPQYFDLGTYQSSDWEVRWRTRITRNSATSGFGRYSIYWNENGFMEDRSNLPREIDPSPR